MYRRASTLALVAFATPFLAGSAPGKTIWHVDTDAPLGGDGLSWDTAYKYVQDALSVATDGDEIRVAEGTHKPDQDEAGNVTAGDRDATFQLVNGVTVKGGYAGRGALCPDHRDITLYETILSGDLNGDDGPDFENDDENSYHVVTGSDTDKSAVLDGFTIVAGTAGPDGEQGHRNGGGIYIDGGSPTVANCIFRRNGAFGFGGAVYNHQSSPTFTGCLFWKNGAGDYGGGMMNEAGSTPTLTNCTFRANRASGAGGGVYNDESNPTLVDCMFIDNFSRYRGGGMYDLASDSTLTHCTFTANSARMAGAGMYNGGGSPTLTSCTFAENTTLGFGGGMLNGYGSPTLTNCSFMRNSGGAGGGMYNGESNATLSNCIFSENVARISGGGMLHSGGDATLANCTFTGNSAEDGGGMLNSESSLTLTNCVFLGNWTDDTGGAMYHLQSDATLVNCVFSANSAANTGGAVYAGTPYWMESNLALLNCTFAANAAYNGSAVACAPPIEQYSNIIELRNCILWNGGDEVYNPGDSTIRISYSNVQGGWSGPGNLDADPLFVPGPAGCYYLSQVVTGQAADSPCVDVGSDTAKNLGLDTLTTRSDEGTDTGIVDMGYHYPVTGQPLIMGDHNRDLVVDLADFAALQNCFTGEGPTEVSPCCRIFDFEPDADADLGDYAAFLLAFDP